MFCGCRLLVKQAPAEAVLIKRLKHVLAVNEPEEPEHLVKHPLHLFLGLALWEGGGGGGGKTGGVVKMAG